MFYKGADDWLVWRAYSGGRWHGEEIFDAAHAVPTRISSAPTVLCGWGGCKFAVFFRGPDGRLRWKAHHGGRWHGDALVDGGGALASAPSRSFAMCRRHYPGEVQRTFRN